MTSAKAIKEAALYSNGIDADGNKIRDYYFSEYMMQAFEEAICREQREICADKSEVECYDLPSKDELQFCVNKNSIINAPKPTTV